MITTSLSRRAAAACGAAVLLAGAVACGSSEDPAAVGASTDRQGTDQVAPDVRAGGQRPGALGKVVAVVDRTAQVQGPDGQVGVTWTGATTFTQQVTATRSEVEVGTCVVVQPAEDAPGAGDASANEVVAGTVRITPAAEDGSCTGGFTAGPVGGPPAGAAPPAGSEPPAGMPQVRGFGTVGEVSAVSGSGFTVRATVPDFGDGPPSAGSTPTMTEQDVAVTVTGTTTYTTTGKASAADVEVGTCLRAEGTTDSTGAVTARTVALSPAVDGECGMVVRRAAPGGGDPMTQES